MADQNCKQTLKIIFKSKQTAVKTGENQHFFKVNLKCKQTADFFAYRCLSL